MLSAQYEVDMLEGFLGPYLGVGLNYTHFSNVTLPAPLDIGRDSWGVAFQAGFDVNVSEKSFVNFDVKKIIMRTDVLAAGTKVDTLQLDPWVYGIGIGMRF